MYTKYCIHYCTGALNKVNALDNLNTIMYTYNVLRGQGVF